MRCPSLRSHGFQATLLFLLAFAFRTAYLVADGKYREDVTSEMMRAGTSLGASGVLGNVYSSDSGPSAHVAPLYACLLGGIHALFGVKSLAAMIVQQWLTVAVSSLVIALVPWFSRRLGLSPTAGNLAAIALAVCPFHLWLETSGAWEQPYGVAISLGLFAALLRLRDRGWTGVGPVTLVGFLTGVLALTSPVMLPFVALAIGVEFLTSAQRLRVATAGAGIAFVALLVMAPWIWRNAQVLGGFVPLRSNFGLELHIGNNAESNGQTFNTSYDSGDHFLMRNHPMSSRSERARLQEIGELAYMREKEDIAKTWIREHPGQFASLTLRRAWLYWLPPPSLWDPSLALRTSRSVVMCAVNVLALVGMVMLFWRRNPYRWLILAYVIGPSLLFLVTHVDPRYRYATFWMSCLLAAYACAFAARISWRGYALRSEDSASRLHGFTGPTCVPLPPPFGTRASSSRRESCESAPSCSRD